SAYSLHGERPRTHRLPCGGLLSEHKQVPGPAPGGLPRHNAGARDARPARVPRAMIEVDIRLQVRDGARRFDLAARLGTSAPFAALYGPSGSGKSLTLQAIA